jgi:hypothetical protein
VKDIIGKKFGRLTIISNPKRIDKSNNYTIVCVCDCGVERTFWRGDVTSGKTKSCGCLSSENTIKRNTKHGKYGSLEYRAWVDMRGRCNYPNRFGYENYGGRGITVCNEWNNADGFIPFLNHIGESPSPKHELDRIDNNLGYFPGNVKWSTDIEQSRNKRNNHIITVFDTTKCIQEWGMEFDISPKTIKQRLDAG